VLAASVLTALPCCNTNEPLPCSRRFAATMTEPACSVTPPLLMRSTVAPLAPMLCPAPVPRVSGPAVVSVTLPPPLAAAGDCECAAGTLVGDQSPPSGDQF